MYLSRVANSIDGYYWNWRFDKIFYIFNFFDNFKQFFDKFIDRTSISDIYIHSKFFYELIILTFNYE